MKVERIDHVSVAVHKPNEAERIWAKALGVEPATRNDGAAQSAEWTSVSRFFVGDTAVELLGATAPQSQVSRFLGKRGEGIYLLCAKVDNAQEVARELKSQGLVVLDQRPGGPTIFVHPKSINGVLLELTETDEQAARLAAARQANGSKGKIERIDHISIAVRDLNQAEPVWERLLGVKAAFRNDGLAQSSGATALARFFIGNTALELLQATSPESQVAKFIERRGEGPYFICFKVDDVKVVAERLRAEDLQVVDNREGISFIHPKSMNGVLVELTEHAEVPPA